MKNVMSFEAWTASGVTNETKNIASKGFPKEDLKDNFKEWKTDHEDKADELFDKLKDRHPDADVEKLKKLAQDWVGTKEEKEVKESLVTEGRIKEIEMLSQESKTKAEFVEKLKAYVKEIGKPELADDKEFIEDMTADFTDKK
jgi:hypothetical protein